MVTSSGLERSLREIGVREGGVLVAHASLSSLGYVVCGAGAVLTALRRALGPEGTLLMPSFTGEFTDPSCWVDPPLPPSMWHEVRDGMPLFDPDRSLPRLMGQLGLTVLMDPGSARSDHPLCSWTALGPRAEELLADHDLRDPFGPRSPIGRAREADAQVLLLGVDQRRNSAILHAHVCSDVPQVRRNKGAFLAEVEEGRQWITPLRFGECMDGYGKLEDDLVSAGLVRVERIGDCDCRLMELGPLAEAVQHMIRNRPQLVFCERPNCRQCRV